MIKLDETLTMLKELTDARGIAGNEREPREVMKKYILSRLQMNFLLTI